MTSRPDETPPEGAMDSRPSNAPPKNYQHTFAEARVYIPEEQKAFALRMSSVVEDKVKRLRVYAQEMEKAEEGEMPVMPADLMRELKAITNNLSEPISEDLLREINFSPTSPGGITWNDIRKLYGSRRIDAVFPLVDKLDEGLSLDEVKRLIIVLDKIREDLEMIVAERGGNSEQRLVEIIGRYKVEEDSKWHRTLFNDIELQHYVLALNTLSERFGKHPSELVIEDLGCGSGRCFDQLRELFEKGFISASGFTNSRIFLKASQEEIRAMAANYHGIDKLESNIEKTRALVRAVMQGADFDETENIKIGDFHMPEDRVNPRVAPGTVHFAFSMMRTAFHNLTEDEFLSFLRTVERDLAPGGIMLMDTVRMRRVEPELREGRDVEAHLDDMKNLYPQIFRANNERYQRLMPAHIRLEDMPRFPIYDNTTGRGFYWREVITQGYIEHMIEKYGLNLEVTMFASHQHNFRDQIKNNPELRRQAAALGKKWIDENELREYYLETINDRLERGVISPRLIEKVAYKGDPEVFLDYLGYHMVRGFASSYTFLEKKMDKDT